MRTYDSVKLGTITDTPTRDALKKMDDYLRSVSGALAKSVFPGQQPPANPVPTGTSSTPPPPGQQVPQPVQGDILYGLNTGTWAKLPIGASSSVLTVSGGTPAWATALSLLPVHDHSNAASGGNIPEASVTNLVSDLAAKAPSSATYITQTASGGLSAEQNLDALATGLLKSTNGTGIITIAAASDLPTHGPTQHTDRTRTVTLRAGEWTCSTVEIGTFPNSYPGIVMANGPATGVTTTMIVPQDYVSGGAVAWKIIYVNAGSSSNGVHWDLYYKIVSDGEDITSANDQTMSGDSTPSAVAASLDIYTVGTTSTSIQAGDVLKLSVQRDPGNGGDSNGSDMDFVCLQFDYTADG